jgi:hypothetical protein
MVVVLQYCDWRTHAMSSQNFLCTYLVSQLASKGWFFSFVYAVSVWSLYTSVHEKIKLLATSCVLTLDGGTSSVLIAHTSNTSVWKSERMSGDFCLKVWISDFSSYCAYHECSVWKSEEVTAGPISLFFRTLAPHRITGPNFSHFLSSSVLLQLASTSSVHS